MAQVFVVFRHHNAGEAAAAAFSTQPAAAAYLQRQQTLEVQRHGKHPAMSWSIQTLEVDAQK